MIDFLGIGAQKAGTTWLTKNLKTHPMIWMPSFAKELHYFDVVHLRTDKNHRLQKLKKICNGIIDNVHKSGKVNADREIYLKKVSDPEFAFSDEWYSYIFDRAPSNMLKGEYTPLYSALNEEGIKHVKRLMPNAKLIYLIRDPIDRAMSSLRMELEIGEKNRKQEDILSDRIFQERGNYLHNIPAWEQEFSPDRILYLPFGKIKKDPLSVLREVENFLGLSHLDEYHSLNDKVNRTGIKSVEIYPTSKQFIEEISQAQYPFLKERFGEEFVSLIK